MPLELLNLRLLVHRHLERQLSLGAERAQRQLPSSDVLNQPVRAPRLVHHPGGVLRAPAAAAPHVEVGQALPEHERRVGAREQRALVMARRAAHQHRQVGPGVGNESGVLDMLGPQLHEAAAALANRRLGQDDFPVADDLQVCPVGDRVQVPGEHAERAAGRHVRRDAESHRSERERNHDLGALPLARPQPLTVTPGGELDALRLADAH